MRMRLLLLGSDNALGQALLREASREGIEFSAPPTPATGFKPTELATLLAQWQQAGDSALPSALVNLTHYFDGFQAENPRLDALQTQLGISAQLAKICGKNGSILLQPSSYLVFDGLRPIAYGEEESSAPLGRRGQMLARMEEAVRAACPQHLVLRFGWLLDESGGGYLDRFLRRAALGGALPAADDRRGSPTPVDDAARVLLAVLKQLDCAAPLWGTYHYGGQEASTSLAMQQAILEEAALFRPPLAATLLAQPHELCADAKEEPQHAVLSCKKILSTFGIKPRAWRVGLHAVLARYFAQEGETAQQ